MTTKKLILLSVIAFVMGGLFMGLLDAASPKPLFSSANSNRLPYDLGIARLEGDKIEQENDLLGFPCIKCTYIEGRGLKCRRVACPPPPTIDPPSVP